MTEMRPPREPMSIPSNFIRQGSAVLMNAAAVLWAAERSRRRRRSKWFNHERAAAILSHVVMPADENGRVVWKADELRQWLHDRGRVHGTQWLRKWLVIFEQAGDIRFEWRGDEITIELLEFDCQRYLQMLSASQRMPARPVISPAQNTICGETEKPRLSH